MVNVHASSFDRPLREERVVLPNLDMRERRARAERGLIKFTSLRLETRDGQLITQVKSRVHLPDSTCVVLHTRAPTRTARTNESVESLAGVREQGLVQRPAFLGLPRFKRAPCEPFRSSRIV
jgi:hypothetical protein